MIPLSPSKIKKKIRKSEFLNYSRPPEPVRQPCDIRECIEKRSALLHSKSDVLEIEIKDTGCGIASQHLPHLFEPFYTTKEGGTGLGLSIARNIIQAHGGTIQLESVEGEGTTVRMLLVC